MEMILATPPEILKLVGHSVRWNLLIRLARSDYRVQELVAYLKLPQNLVSYHLRQLRGGSLVTERKSNADERSVYYSLDLERFRSLYLHAGEQLYPALSMSVLDREEEDKTDISQRAPLRVLFLCTENSARSQIAEALLRSMSHGSIEVFSAGSHPAERVHPLAIRAIEQIGSDVSQVRPKHFDEFLGQQFDVTITVCDRVREVCPVFPNDPERIHWSIPDPALVEGAGDVRYATFEQTSLQLATRIRVLLTLLERERRCPL
jgi:ArsR family transcriptional regulator, arsenate/arsenite/antimonite-responsive transcriptional repressor / arsenate reductase (thioredoxin)